MFEVKVFWTLVSTVIGWFLYARYGSSAARLRRDQFLVMRNLASHAEAVWDQWLSVLSAEARNPNVPARITPGFRTNLNSFESVLNTAIATGMKPAIVGTHNQAEEMYAAFRDALTALGSAGEHAPIEPGTKFEFLKGMTRLLDFCVKYKPALFLPEIREEVRRKISGVRV
jgi:hypothetical protein